jgi:putative salt-induced outer membrane protein YdiY
MSKLKILALSAAFVLLASVVILAEGNDQIILKNGDRLTGKIVKKEADKIILQTAGLGEVTISAEAIDKIIAAETAVKEETAKEVKYVNAEMETEKTVIEPDKEPVLTVSGKKQTSFRDGWEGSADIGFSFTSGNSQTTTLSGGIRGAKVQTNSKLSAYANTLINRSKVGSVSTTTSRAVWGGLRYDRNLTERWFAFGSFDFEHDRPQKLNLRTVLGAGLGYHAIKNEKTTLDIFSGLAYNREWFVNAPNRNSIELLIGDEFKHKFNERTYITQRLVIYPNLSNTGEFRAVWDSSLNTNLTKKIGWFITIGDRYNSQPAAGAKSNDFLFATGLRMAFGKAK